MKVENTCLGCVHYDFCSVRVMCNSYASRVAVAREDAERNRAELEKSEYTEAYIDYIDYDKY